MTALHGLRDAGVDGADRDAAAARHGVAGVNRQVNNDLIELAAIHPEQPQIPVVIHLQFYILANQSTQQIGKVGQGLGNIQHHRLQFLLAREGQQLTHQIGRPVGVLFDLLDIGKRRIVRAMAGQQQIGKTDHGGQQIIEIMGNAPGKLADSLHFLRLGELYL